MKLASYIYQNEAYIGTVVDNQIFPLVQQGSMQAIIENGDFATASKGVSLDAVTLQAPIIPGKIIAIGRNYGAHVAELGNKLPEKPLIFSIYPSSVIASGDVIEWKTSLTNQVDWEGELAVVIGKTGKDIPEEQAYEYVFGYTIANDVSARDLQDGDGQWTRAKGLDTFCPLGSWVVTKDEIPDPHDLSIQTSVNGQQMQNGHTSDMVFKIPYLLAYCSQAFTLNPGDILLTGTPDGVGKGMKPPRFLHTGDVVEVTIENMGSLKNSCREL